MATSDNAAIARAFNDAYNARDWDAAAALVAADAEVINVPTGQSFQGPDGASGMGDRVPR
jgi:ketosteroid isomerase-like protein